MSEPYKDIGEESKDLQYALLDHSLDGKLVWDERAQSIALLKSLKYSSVIDVFKSMILEKSNCVAFKTYSNQHAGDIKSTELDEAIRVNSYKLSDVYAVKMSR